MTKELFVSVLVLIALLFLETTAEDNAVCLFFIKSGLPYFFTHAYFFKNILLAVSETFFLSQ